MGRTPLRSMTGFGESERELPVGRLSVQLRTVNHRYLNLQFRLPPGAERHQPPLERTLRGFFVRGHVTVGISIERPTAGSAGAPPPVSVDLERARGYVEALREVKEALGLSGEVEVGVLPWFRDLFRETEGREVAPDLPEEILLEAIAEAAGRVNAMREAEGARLGTDLEERLAVMEGAVSAVALRAPERLLAERDRLRAAIQELLGAELKVDEERLAREVAHMAERWDIHEEIVRFRSHLEMFRGTLREGDPTGVGKRLGFIAQELLREANTMGSKANDAEIARRVVLLKEEIDRVREQVENLE